MSETDLISVSKMGPRDVWIRYRMKISCNENKSNIRMMFPSTMNVDTMIKENNALRI